jgi:DNA repair protein RadC
MKVKQPSGRYRDATDEEILAAASAILEKQLMRMGEIFSSASAQEFLRYQIGPRPYEVFFVVFLDNRHKVISWQEMFRGTIDGASVYPREVVKEALKQNAAAVLLAHNHPSGIAEPSQADINITRTLKEALGLVGVRVLDHMIIGGREVTSLAERGAI